MRNFFSLESPVMKFLDSVGDLIILNICFLIGSLPVITAGASLTALYSVSLKLVRNEEGGVFTVFWKAWKENFRQGTLAWLLVLAAAGFFAFEQSVVGVMGGTLGFVFRIAWYILDAVFAAIVWFLFPYMARFEDRLKVCIGNALRFSLLHILYTLVSLALLAGLLALTLWTPETLGWMLFFWLTIGFALIACIHSVFVRKFFEPFEK